MRVRGFDLADWHEQRACMAFATALQKVIRRLKRDRQPFARIAKLWEQVAPDLTERTRILGFGHGVLDLAVTSAPLRAELEGYRKHELIDALRAHPRGTDVADIKFRLAPAGEPR